LQVVYQPIVALDSGRTFAAEALVRCSWPEYSNPVALFRQAESEHTCGRLGRMIRDLTFRAAPSLPMFVNVHPQELSSRWLVRPDDPINFADADVYLEITESATFEHFDLCLGVLAEVRSRTGARLAVDDFGAGYSNLRRVIELEPAVIKLDRELVRGIDRSARLQLLVRWVVRLCQELGARAVAEGIETMAEFKAVRDAGVDYAQGFFLARPGCPLPAVNWPKVSPRSRPRQAVSAGHERSSKGASPPRSTRHQAPTAARPRGAVEEVFEARSKPPGRLHPQRPSRRPSKRPSGPPGSERHR
jgi:EAL domain-containing protein (putative c-di-GMP-specific phosphodiesterase class I)